MSYRSAHTDLFNSKFFCARNEFNLLRFKLQNRKKKLFPHPLLEYEFFILCTISEIPFGILLTRIINNLINKRDRTFDLRENKQTLKSKISLINV